MGQLMTHIKGFFALLGLFGVAVSIPLGIELYSIWTAPEPSEKQPTLPPGCPPEVVSFPLVTKSVNEDDQGVILLREKQVRLFINFPGKEHILSATNVTYSIKSKTYAGKSSGLQLPQIEINLDTQLLPLHEINELTAKMNVRFAKKEIMRDSSRVVYEPERDAVIERKIKIVTVTKDDIIAIDAINGWNEAVRRKKQREHGPLQLGIALTLL